MVIVLIRPAFLFLLFYYRIILQNAVVRDDYLLRDFANSLTKGK
jgi:hypothetical protein